MTANEVRLYAKSKYESKTSFLHNSYSLNDKKTFALFGDFLQIKNNSFSYAYLILQRKHVKQPN